MKILSRPTEQPVGNGDFTIRMTFEELQYLGALLYVTRLGKDSVFKTAAYNLLTAVEDLFGDDFVEDAANEVDLYVSKLNEEDGDTIEEQWHHTEISLEV